MRCPIDEEHYTNFDCATCFRVDCERHKRAMRDSRLKSVCSIDITNDEYTEFKRLEMLLNDENLSNLKLKELGDAIQQETHDLDKTRRFLVWFILNGLQSSWLIDAIVKE